jgi:hypothetical protein
MENSSNSPSILQTDSENRAEHVLIILRIRSNGKISTLGPTLSATLRISTVEIIDSMHAIAWTPRIIILSISISVIAYLHQLDRYISHVSFPGGD